MNTHMERLVRSRTIDQTDTLSINFSNNLITELPHIFKDGFMMVAPVHLTEDEEVVTAKVHVFAAHVTPEVQNDLRLVVGNSWEVEFLHVLSQELAYEYENLRVRHEKEGLTLRPYVPALVKITQTHEGTFYNFEARFGLSKSDKPFL